MNDFWKATVLFLVIMALFLAFTWRDPLTDFVQHNGQEIRNQGK